MTPIKLVQHEWKRRDLVGGDPALDFANTISGWGMAAEDWLANYAGLARWALLADLVDESEYRKGLKAASQSPLAAERVYAEMNELRSAFLRLLHAVRDRDAAKADDLSLINQWIRRAADAFRLRQASRGFQEAWSDNAPVLQKPLLAAAHSIGRFLEHADFDRLKVCPNLNCSWLFIDRSKNHSRRWCDMGVCGNLAKARRFQARKQKGAALH